jgi:mycothiol synthase
MNDSALVPVVAVVRSDGDLADMIEVRVQADPDAPAPRLDNLRNNLAGNPSLAYLIARLGDSPAGCGFVDVSPETFARAHVVVVPAARRRGVGTALLDGVSEHARAANKTHLEGQIRASDGESLAFFARRGFERVGGEEAVALDLAEADAVSAEAPPGVRIVSRAERPDLVEAMYAVACEAESDIPGGDPVRPFEVWRSTEIDRPSLRPELTFVALAGDEVVGYAILDTLGGEHWHRLTAVKRAWRRRGVATALKRAQIEAARRGGLSRLVTTNEERNVAMRSINEALGYRPEPRLSTIVVRGPVSG